MKINIKAPNWKFWQLMLDVKPWQACALAFNIEPDTLIVEHSSWGNSTYSAYSLPGHFEYEEISQQFRQLQRLLMSHLNVGGHFTRNNNGTVRLNEFAAWCEEIGRDIPIELKVLAKTKERNQPSSSAEPTEKQDEQNIEDGWKLIARNIGINIYKQNPYLSIEQIAEKTRTELIKNKITGRGNRVPSAETIKRHALKCIKT